ncbi:MAG: hypothetical protein ACTSSK_03580 [Candidatus Heimdallarchaeota archaeon]
MEVIHSIKVIVEVDTNKGTYREEMEGDTIEEILEAVKEALERLEE